MAQRKKRTISEKEIQDSLQRVVILPPTGHASPTEVDVFVNFLFDILYEDFQRRKNESAHEKQDIPSSEAISND